MFNYEVRWLGQLDSLTLTGHLLSLLAIVGLLLAPGIQSALVVTAILTLAYVGLAWRTQESVHLYPAALFLTAFYILGIGIVVPQDAMLLGVLPLQFVLFGIGKLLRNKGKKDFAVALEVGAHISGFYLTAKVIQTASSISQPGLALIGLIIFALSSFGLGWINRERWFVFAGMVYLALAYLSAMQLFPVPSFEGLIINFSMVAVVYALLGWWVRNARGEGIAEPVETAALFVGIIGSIAALSDGTTIGMNALLIIAVACGILYVSSRSEGYIYLILLTAGAIGYQFVRIAGERFSPKLVDQFLVGLVIVGIIFLYPIIRRMFSGEDSLQQWFVGGGWVRVLLIGAPLVILGSTIGVSYVFEFTANPTFCGSCHVMQVQYDAWERSSHNEITCGTCHYPPGAELFFQGKVAGLTEVVNFITGNYGTKPHGTVHSANCEACHSIEDLVDVSSPYRGLINFNHTELNPENDMGITMRCNNCHSHITDDYHFQVRESTCYWCHFMGSDGQSTAVGTCFSCHETPIDDDHLQVVDSNQESDCTTSGCHDSVTVGDGEVRPERCLSCHGQIDPRVNEFQPMHDLHIVAETTFLSSKVECLDCHNEISHGE
ncbi:MAG: hypothetical protein FVQ83_16065 [Chloroflexi bacterium]|nr:hypothetical protein [Chloroflexota bacterium]